MVPLTAAAPMRSVFQPGRSVRSSSCAAPPPPPPLLVLIHGLESFSGTWDGVMRRLAVKAPPTPDVLAVDLRGHGWGRHSWHACRYTPPGAPADFSPAALAADVIAAARAHNRGGAKVVICGHSMGGRVAMRMAADFPGEIRACVVEDMDTRPRPALTAFDYDALESFEPSGPSAAEVAARLTAAAPDVFTEARVAGYVERGRIMVGPDGETAVALVHPLGFALAYDAVLRSDDAALAMVALSEMDPATRPEMHFWRAPPAGGELDESDGGSSAAETDVERLKGLGGLKNRGWLNDAVFAGAGHSVHNTRQEAFVAALAALVLDGKPAASEV